MKLAQHTMLDLVSKEALITDGGGKYLLLAMVFNIPVIGFIPYLTQAFTIILLSFFLKHVIVADDKQRAALAEHTVRYRMNAFGKGLIVVTMLFQAVWIPFVMQFITLASLGIIYATMTKYK